MKQDTKNTKATTGNNTDSTPLEEIARLTSLINAEEGIECTEELRDSLYEQFDEGVLATINKILEDNNVPKDSDEALLLITDYLSYVNATAEPSLEEATAAKKTSMATYVKAAIAITGIAAAAHMLYNHFSQRESEKNSVPLLALRPRS